jgi:cobalt-zinc-cadmium efflux system membrane fusion protein
MTALFDSDRRAGVRAHRRWVRASMFVAALLSGAPPAGAGENGHADGADRQQVFSVADFENNGVTVATAAPGDVDVEIELPAEVRPNADRVAHLAPRFPGLVLAVHKSIGDSVRKGEILARIESDNLSIYDLVAGFDGVVIDKHVAPGESIARQNPAFVIADLSTVWVSINVYQKALPSIAVGQSVRVATLDGAIEANGVISYVAPVVSQATRTATARVVLHNPDRRWRPGLFVIAAVSRPVAAAVVVARSALHSLDGHSVVFVVRDGTFEAREVTIGAVGRTVAEIVSGLSAGERYAAAGSFLVKAELAKGEAGHDH